MPMSDEGGKKPFSLPRLILCEGPDDAAFLSRLITVRDLPRCPIRHSGKSRHSPGGNTKFDDALRTARLNDAFDKIKRILIVSDNDDDPNTSFRSVRRQIESAGFGPAPAQELTASDGRPHVTILMLPMGGNEGNLECF